ncbi:hypothetical protein SAY86_016906 [Trapa natans]|uniref:Pentatricopeptide repeat-containing protein n=1 Tax=Trapa natans TaxID=22666 RepID=A0AAN7R4M6_TRANT|nr:hypothetical protein SAY86_016906 [Trapa natans]
MISSFLRRRRHSLPSAVRRTLHTLAPLTTASDFHGPSFSLPTLLSSSTCLRDLSRFHAHLLRIHFLFTFPYAVHYNNLIRAYTRLEAPGRGLSVFILMSRNDVRPDCYTVPIVVKAAGQRLEFALGWQVHGIAIKLGLEQNEFCESGFISLYCKAGQIEEARKVFDENPERKIGSWNAILSGLAQGGRAKEAISMFLEMKRLGFIPDDVSMVSITSACGALGELKLALQLHKCVYQAAKGGEGKSGVLMLNSMIDMYGKCGRMDLANKVFLRMQRTRNVSSWTSMIVGYGCNGLVRQALDSFSEMLRAGVVPNHVTFVGVLTACVHGGLVQEGRHYFGMMKRVYGIAPNQQHYGCLIDLLGRAGLFEDTREVIETMPMKPNSVIFGCLMGACEKFGNVLMAEWVAKHLIELEPWNDGVYVVLSNIYATRGLWGEVDRIRVVMKERELAKVPGYSLASCLD